MKRCNYCGFENPQDRETCVKCNKPLTNSATREANSASPKQENQDRPTNYFVEDPRSSIHPASKAVVGFDPKKTVREEVLGEVATCPECGCPLEDGECPSCGYKVGGEKPQPVSDVDDLRKTKRPNRKGEKEAAFKLVPISEETGMQEGEELSYEGNKVVLNRDNTDPKNTTITSQKQASLSFENGKWSIKDKSELQTTFVQAARKIELQEGDLILLGNQLYRFEL